ncbi:hypothetical protein K435DRAFT_828282 [Dendrothele bispora CBS 962.96]|uniref:DUF7223 domain-containing protein n=1 Tax=Dendrothele bispora (strain CBS 962.96) TaxID=1314807 RepID=A0A4S8M997_DENBC|nr:hypothetical protein K435DRAFT_828282 [Dendrothele bispora CBS 962.96]
MSLSTIALLSLLSSAAYGFTNDWTQPCFDGQCAYSTDLGSFKVVGWGSPNAITDITAAAGWEILNCDPNALTQDIRLVCTNSEGCSHFYQSNGPVGKLVRLPQNCGGSAFARISRNWVHEDQSLPANLARSLRRRDGTTPDVQGLALDTDFAAVDPAQNGNVSIAIEGSNVPGAVGNAEVTPAPARRSRLRRRGFLKDIFNKFNTFDKNITKDLPPIDVTNQTFPIFEDKVSCPASGSIPAFDASIKADVVANAHAVISLGAAATGTIIPPKLDEFGVFVGLNADLKGTLELVGSASGTADSGKISLFEVGVPGLDFPGILTLGPSFKIQGQATANLDIDANLSVDLAYHVDNAKLFFPPSDDAASNGGFSPLDSPLKLSVSPSVNSSATVAAHLIPTIDLGVSALGGIAEATIFLDLDASVSTTLSLNAGAVASVTTDGDKSASADVNGCVDVGAGFDVNAGADGSFFGLFDKTTQINLFSKKFELFKKCLGTSTSTRRDLEVRSLPTAFYHHKRALACPALDPANLVSVAEEAIPADSIAAL